MKSLVKFLSSVNIFSDLTESEMDVLQKALKIVKVESGECLFKEGDPGDELFVVKTGKISISVGLEGGGSIDITDFKKKDFFGEMSIFEGEPRSASCVAREKTELLSLKGADFFTLMSESPQAATKIMHRMLNITAMRLYNTNEFLSEMVRWGEKARKRAISDEFTGLFNRRFLDAALERQFKDASLNNKRLTFVMVDLDHFGTLNSEYGQKVGDDIILKAVSVFKKVFKQTDILARYGGDEFSFILPDQDAVAAKSLCDKVCENLRKIKMLEKLDGKINKITSSIGIASFPDHAGNLKELIDNTDTALYDAKEQGRNRAVIFRKVMDT